MSTQWRGFKGNKWKNEVNVRDFIQHNYTSYDGDESFLAGPTQATETLWGKLQELQKEERAKGGVLDMETEVVSSLTAYGPAYKKLSVSRQTSHSSAHLCLTVVLRWQHRLVLLTVTNHQKNLQKSSLNIARLTMTVCSTVTHQKCVWFAMPIFLLVLSCILREACMTFCFC